MKKNLILCFVLCGLLAPGQPFTLNDPAMLSNGFNGAAPPSPPPAPVLQFKMNDGTGTATFVESIAGLNASGLGTYWTGENDVNGNANHAEGALNGTQIGTNGAAVVTGYPMTLSVWVKTTDTGGNFPCGVYNNSSYGDCNCIRVGNGYWLAFTTGDAGAGYPSAYCDGPSVTDGNWHNLVAVFTSATSRTTYTDGGSQGVETDGGNATAIGLTDAAFGAKAVVSPTSFWTGYIDDFRVYNYALTASQAAAIHTLGPQ
jgi:hypothetical protein